MGIDNRHPYIKFYPRDWLGDSALRMISPDERGVWIDLLCLMAGGTPYGHLALNGKPLTDEAVSRAVGVEIGRFRDILASLECHGIPSRTPEGVLYSRRLVREHSRFISCREFGRKGGGNPALHSESEKEHNPESRIQKPEAKGTLKVPFKGTLKVRNKPILAFTDDFLKFWEAYPNKSGKKYAFKCWLAAKDKPALDIIIAAIKAQAQSAKWTRDNGDYIPLPSTWLNQGRWDDVPEVSTAPKISRLDIWKAEDEKKKAAQAIAETPESDLQFDDREET
jgi:hypothetical protein